MTQRELATEMNVHTNVIGYWCRSARVPNTEQIIGMAQFFGVSADYLLGLTDKQTPDIDLQAICIKTGLTEQSAVNLIRLMTNNVWTDGEASEDYTDMSAAAFNALLENWKALDGLALALYGVMNDCDKAKHYLSKHNDESIGGLAKVYQTGKVIDGMELSYFKACEAFRRTLDKAFDYRNIIDDLQREG